MSVGFSVPRDVFLTDRWAHLGPSERHFLQQIALNHYNQRLQKYETAWKAYQGEMPLPLKKTVTDKDGKDNVIVPNPTLIVDTVVANLFGERAAPTFEVEVGPQQQEPSGRSEPEQWLDGFWEANRRLVTLDMTATNGAVFGHAWIRLSEPTRLTEPYPRLSVLNPQEMTAVTDPDDIEHVVEYQQTWHYVDDNGQTVWRRQRHAEQPNRLAWVIYDEVLGPNAQGWQLLKPPQAWPHAWSQVHDCQHLPLPNTYYGRSELEPQMLQVANAVNFNYSNINRILRNHGHPKTWISGFTGNELIVDPDKAIILPSADARLGNLEMESDLTGAHRHADKLEDAFYRLARVPRISVGTMEDSSNLSAVALALRFRPLEDKIGVLRLQYGRLLSQLNRHALELGRHGEDQHVRNVWPQLLPKDALTERQTAQLDQILGVSRATTLTMLGYDAKREQERRDAEGFATVPTTTPQGVRGRPDLATRGGIEGKPAQPPKGQTP